MTQRKILRLRQGRKLEFGTKPCLMGTLNATPDSFSDGGRHHGSAAEALAHALQMLEDGARIIDIGGESTRPGSPEVSAGEEIERVVPVVELLRKEHPDCAISVDTRKLKVAEAALDAGADMVNDVSGLQFDPGIAKLAAEKNAALCLMHMRGVPATMQEPGNLVYEELIDDISNFLVSAASKAEAAGVSNDSIVLDPGLGFSKTLEQNVELMSCVDSFHALGYPLLVGPSRKTFIGTLTGERNPCERDFGTCGAAAWLALQGVQIIRVHNVKAVRQALSVFLPCAGL